MNITKTFEPTQEMIESAEAWIKEANRLTALINTYHVVRPDDLMAKLDLCVAWLNLHGPDNWMDLVEAPEW